MSKTLVTYFSATGTTKKVAENIKEVIGGDLFEIEPVEKYTDADLDWSSKTSRSTIEMQDKSFRPPVKNKVENIDNYDTVLIGFPVWWYTAPTIINTFVEENNLEGKKIYLFCTSGGSKIDKCLENLQKDYSNLNIISGKTFTGREEKEEILDWLN